MPDKMSSEPNLVCTDATFLYHEISKVLTVQYADKDPSIQDKDPSIQDKDPICRFRETGEIPAVKARDLFGKDALSVDESIPPAWLLNVLAQCGLPS